MGRTEPISSEASRYGEAGRPLSGKESSEYRSPETQQPGIEKVTSSALRELITSARNRFTFHVLKLKKNYETSISKAGLPDLSARLERDLAPRVASVIEKWTGAFSASSQDFSDLQWWKTPEIDQAGAKDVGDNQGRKGTAQPRTLAGNPRELVPGERKGKVLISHWSGEPRDAIDPKYYGNRWHLVETDDRGNFFSQYSWPQNVDESGRVMKSKILQVGQRSGGLLGSQIRPQAEAPTSPSFAPPAARVGNAISDQSGQPNFSGAPSVAQRNGPMEKQYPRSVEGLACLLALPAIAL